MSGWLVAVVVGIVWPVVALVVAWRVGRRLQAAGDRCPPASGDVVCPGCAACSPAEDVSAVSAGEGRDDDAR